MISKWPFGALFHFFKTVRIKRKQGSFEHGKTWFGRCVCCLVSSANLHNLLRISIKMAPTGTFSLFLGLLQLKVKQGNLEHGQTLFGRRVCCFVISANLHNLPRIGIKMTKMAQRVLFSLFLGLLGLKVKR